MNDFKAVKKSGEAQLRLGYLCAILALTLAVCALGCVSVVSSCEKDARYFSPSIIPAVFAIGIVLAVALSFSALFIFRKERTDFTDTSDAYSKVTRCTNLLPALLSLCLSLFALFDESLGEWGNAVMICGAVASVFFIFKFLSRYAIAKVISGFGIFALGAVIIASLYLDLTVEINSHFKLLVQFGATGMLIGTIADLRAALSPKASEGSASSDSELVKIGVRGFIFLKSLALVPCLVCSAVIILYFAEGNAAFGLHYLIYSLLYLAFAVPCAMELIGAVISVVKSHI